MLFEVRWNSMDLLREHRIGSIATTSKTSQTLPTWPNVCRWIKSLVRHSTYGIGSSSSTLGLSTASITRLPSRMCTNGAV